VLPNSTEPQMRICLNPLSRPDQDRGLLAPAVFCLFLLLAAATVNAQQITGTPGSPSATTTINGRQIPNPPAPFGGVINLNALDSKPYWQPQVVPPKGAPNILLILTDDVGFGAPSTFGGIIPTPALDRIASMGLRYTQFHTTSLCSPTRAALITGRNHHSVGFGVVTEFSTGYPGYDSVIPLDSVTIVGIPQGAAPSILNRSFTITADIEVPAAGGEGMLVTAGGRFGGWAFYLLEGKPVFVYNLLDLARPRIESAEALSPGKHTVKLDFTYDGPGFGKGGTAVIAVDGTEVANQKLPYTVPFQLEASETFDVGSDTGTGVDDADYKPPFAFTGKLNKLTLSLGQPQLTSEDEKGLRELQLNYTMSQ